MPISIPQSLIPTLQWIIIECPPTDLPITYLGLPLSIRKPTKVHFQVLVKKVQDRLAGWKAGVLSLGGHVTLVKSVLTALPLHYMPVTRRPKWTIKQIDRSMRAFLWRGNETCMGINCLANWDKVCTLRANGGMGILNLNVQKNDALLLKWLWKLQTQQGSARTTLMHGFTPWYNRTNTSRTTCKVSVITHADSTCTTTVLFNLCETSGPISQ